MKSIRIKKKVLTLYVVCLYLTACASVEEQRSVEPLSIGEACGDGCQLPELTRGEQASGPTTIWDILASDYRLLEEYRDHPSVREQVERYKRNPAFFRVVSQRSERYLHFVVETLQERDMPLELALLPMVESAYDPFAYSHGRASGLWQFVPITARHLGLRRSWWYDGRRDVVSSTVAAIDYLEYLNDRFDGDWLLTLAAYNAGPGTVNRAIQRNRRSGEPTDYWSLPLPRETRQYVPKLFALSHLIENADSKALELHPIPREPYFEMVDTGGQLDLAQAADLADISIEELYHLNPAFNRWATDPDGPHRLLVPAEAADTFQERLAAIPDEERLSWELYEVQPGDSLIRISRRFDTPVSVIRAANDLEGNLIRTGDSLLLPSAAYESDHYSHSEEQRLARAQARGERGNRQRVDHTVRSGDSLWTIARKHGVSVEALASWNNMAPRDTIRPGQELAVWKNDTGQASSADSKRSREVVRRVGYTVRQGDSLARIATRFRVSVTEIVEWNSINTSEYLQPGQRLTLYVDVTR